MRSQYLELVRPPKRCLGALDTVSWPWAPAWGSLEPPRRDGENAQKTGIFGGKMGEIRSKRCKGVGITWPPCFAPTFTFLARFLPCLCLGFLDAAAPSSPYFSRHASIPRKNLPFGVRWPQALFILPYLFINEWPVRPVPSAAAFESQSPAPSRSTSLCRHTF